MRVTVEHPLFGPICFPGFPVNSAEANAAGHRVAPDLGEHSQEILTAAGFAPQEIAQLIAEKVIKGKRDQQ